jgi:hypothetical protein
VRAELSDQARLSRFMKARLIWWLLVARQSGH